MNTNQLRIHLGLDYRTVKHHLEVLLDNELIYSLGSGYGSMFFLTPRIEEHMDEFNEIWGSINKKINGESDEK